MFANIMKGNFLPGYKSYIILWGGIAVTWVGFAAGVDLACAWGGGDPATCTPPDLSSTIQVTWAALSGILIRKGVSG